MSIDPLIQLPSDLKTTICLHAMPRNTGASRSDIYLCSSFRPLPKRKMLPGLACFQLVVPLKAGPGANLGHGHVMKFQKSSYKATHQKMIDVLLRHANTTSEPEMSIEETESDVQPASPTPAPRTSKRKRQSDDSVVDSDIMFDDDYEDRVIKRQFVSENLCDISSSSTRRLRTIDTNVQTFSSRTNPAQAIVEKSSD